MSLIDSLMNLITPGVVSSASNYFGESSGSTERGLGAAMASVMAGATGLASSDGGLSLSDLMRKYAPSDNMLGNIGSVFTRGGNASNLTSNGQQVLGELFGSRTGEVASSLESFAGIKNSTATSMLSMAGPVVLGFLARHQASQALTSSGLASQLTSQRDSLTRFLPPGIASVAGLAAPLGTATASGSQRTAPHMLGFASGAATTTHYGVERNRWLLPLLLLLGVIALASWLATRNTTRAPAMTAARCPANVTLPSGGALQLEANTLNCNLATFLGSGSAAELPRTFVFDRLNFPTDSAQPTADSAATIATLASVLAAYPNAAVTLTGHTDNTGDAEANRKLSLDRANAVRDQLVAAGIDSGRITTQGYGQDRPVTSNDTADGRARNRRTELTVTQK
jgi:outer membrane protein OmpA-like peptidoglycan-associated protein